MSALADLSGNLTIINATPFTWHRSLEQSYQMTIWDFPVSINPGLCEYKRMSCTEH